MNQTHNTPATGAAWLVAMFIWVFFSAPLFMGLDRSDLRNDEAIYSYSVEKILETNDWLTPQYIPTDHAFLEKPPLKLWIVAGAMALGLTPTDEIGMRVFDAFFGALAFGYIVMFALRLGGPLAAAVALLVAWTFDPLLFQALRGNHMEAALLLTYCGGIWHFMRWAELDQRPSRHLHAFAFAAYFVFGFMTKFVAALFLPMIAVVWLASSRGGIGRILSTWKDWILPAAASLATILPWFVYQSFEHGRDFWHIILGQHVIARLTGVLHSEHLQPWHFYFTQTWTVFAGNGSLWFVVAGLAVILWQTWRGSALARLLLVWWLLPLTIISFGTSKLIFYALPFIPPLALGAGWACTVLYRAIEPTLPAFLSAARRRAGRLAQYVDARPRLVLVLLVLSGLCVALAAWTIATATPFTLTFGGIRWFRSSSIARALAIAALLLVVSGRIRPASWMTFFTVLTLALPLHMYRQQLDVMLHVDHPLRAARNCMLDEQRAGRAVANGLYLTEPSLVSHSPFYYLRHLGEWQFGPDNWREEATRRLSDAAATPVIMSEAQWSVLQPSVASSPGAPATNLQEGIRAIRVDDGLLLLPGPYAACEGVILAQGGRPYTGNSVER